MRQQRQDGQRITRRALATAAPEKMGATGDEPRLEIAVLMLHLHIENHQVPKTQHRRPEHEMEAATRDPSAEEGRRAPMCE